MSQRDLIANFDRMRREMDELLGDSFERHGLARRHSRPWPPVDVVYASDPARAIVTAELAGVRIEDIALQIEGRKLFLAGRRGPAPHHGDAYQQIEIQRGSFRRLIELGADVDADRISARFENGMLYVELPIMRRVAARRTVPVRGSEHR